MKNVKDIRSLGCLTRTAAALGMSVVIALVYVILAAVSITQGEGQSTLEILSWTFGELMAFYFGVALLGGLIVGVLLPIARRRLGAWLLGFLVSGFYLAPLGLSIEPDIGFFFLAWLAVGPVIGVLTVLFLWRPLAEEA